MPHVIKNVDKFQIGNRHVKKMQTLVSPLKLLTNCQYLVLHFVIMFKNIMRK